jgi:hypothetical protein
MRLSPIIGAIILTVTSSINFEWYLSLPLAIALCLIIMPMIFKHAFQKNNDCKHKSETDDSVKNGIDKKDDENGK